MSVELKLPAMKQPPAKKRGSRRLLLLLFIFFATILVILFFKSSFSKVQTIEIIGNDLIAADAVGQASQIKPGDNFFLIHTASAVKRIHALSSIESVAVRKQFPGVIRITVKEYPRVAFQLDDNGKIQIVLANGSNVSLTGRAIMVDKPLLANWGQGDPQRMKLCAVLRDLDNSLLSDVSEIKSDPTAAMEDRIKIYTRSQFEVYTQISLLAEKLPYMGDIIKFSKEEKNIQSGVLTMLGTNYVSEVGKDPKPQATSTKEPDKAQKTQTPKETPSDPKKR